MIFAEKRFLVLTGNYGSGKTEIALNLSRAFRKEGSVTLVDLDIVNPYFRGAEKADQLQAEGIRVLMPTFALSTVDIPALPPEIQSVFEVPCDHVIFDVGGDDTGAAALGRYAPSFARYRARTIMALVVNCMRPLTRTPEDIVDLGRRIAARARMQPDVLVNNTNLADFTTREMMEEGRDIIEKAARILEVPKVVDACMPRILAGDQVIPVKREMVPDWMENA